MRPLVVGAWVVLLGEALLALAGASSAQTVGTSRTKIPQDPAAIELNRLLTAAQDAVNKNDFASAAQDYRDYLAKKPDDAVVHYDLGYAYSALQKPAEAKSEFDTASSLTKADYDGVLAAMSGAGKGKDSRAKPPAK